MKLVYVCMYIASIPTAVAFVLKKKIVVASTFVLFLKCLLLQSQKPNETKTSQSQTHSLMFISTSDFKFSAVNSLCKVYDIWVKFGPLYMHV